MSVKRLARVLNYIVWAVLIVILFVTLAAPAWILNIIEFEFAPFSALIMAAKTEGQQIFMAALTVYSGLLIAGILYGVTFLLSSIVKGEPFCRRNAKSLIMASYLCFALLVGLIVKCFVVPSLMTWVFIAGTVLFGLIFLVLACLFRMAAQIKEENELTI